MRKKKRKGKCFTLLFAYSLASYQRKGSIDERSSVKSKDKNTFKNSRNSYIKTSRTKNDIVCIPSDVVDDTYIESYPKKSIMTSAKARKSIKKTPQYSESQALSQIRRDSGLKINVRDTSVDQTSTPQTAHNGDFYKHDFGLRPSQTYHENLTSQRHGLMERMNRIEKIISSGHSYERLRDENFNPEVTQNDYCYQGNALSPNYKKRAAVSPIVSNRLNK